MINKAIKELLNYALGANLIEKDDEIYCLNRVLEILLLDSFEEHGEIEENRPLQDILDDLLDYAAEKGIIGESVTERDLLDTKIMAVFMPLPHEVIKQFKQKYAESPQKATDWYYKLSCDSNYIRRQRIAKDMKWKYSSPYGELDITINLSKPEKSPEEIAKAKLAASSSYPKCLLCKENEGYAGRLNHPARQNHRIIPLTINNTDWGLQYSPYVYYNEHCILFNKSHTPMVIDRSAFDKLFDFIDQFPHYFIGSNADLPIVGGSILAHEHFQGGHYTFAMETAEIEKQYNIAGFEDVAVGRVNWPMSVLRLSGKDRHKVAELAGIVLEKWRNYTDQSSFIFAETDGEKHNTITPIARRRGENFELDLVLRNNITTDEYPLGVFHPHQNLHHIKKENIGLIEVMGLAVLPSRLKTELKDLEKAILEGSDIRQNETLKKHADWVDELKTRYTFDKNNTEEILKQEVGAVFMKVLEDAGVYKRNEEGMNAFDKFVASV